MFASAYKIASEFTIPVVSSVRLSDNTVNSALATAIIINREGWIITVAHIFNNFIKAEKHKKEIAEHIKIIKSIEDDPTLLDKQKIKKISSVKRSFNKVKRIINQSFWWGSDNYRITKYTVNGDLDLAVGQINDFDPKRISQYPKFKNPKNLQQGTFLCKLGFPFHNIKTTWDKNRSGFVLDSSQLPIPRFPIEGMFTRNATAGKTKDGKYDINFIETSTPGLKGQSGGPIYDKDCKIWGVQSRTSHLPLGFTPIAKVGTKKTEEHQFINVGLGVATDSVQQFLRDNKISFDTAE